MPFAAGDIQPAVRACAGGDAVHVRLKVVPGASRTRLVGMLGDRLKLLVAAPPEAGKANKAVCQLLAKLLGVARSDIAIVAGVTQPEKTAAVAGLPAERVVEQLVRALAQ